MTEMPHPPPPPPSTPTVRIGDWFNAAFDQIKVAWVEYVVAIIGPVILLFLATLLCLIPVLFVGGPLTAGIYIFVAKKILGVPTEAGDVFKGFRKFVDTTLLFLIIFSLPLLVLALLVVPGLLSALASMTGSDALASIGETLGCVTGCFGCFAVVIFQVAYPLIVGTLFVFAYPLVLFRDMSAISALKQSVRVVTPSFVNFLLLFLAGGVVWLLAKIVGFLALGIGLLLTMPLAAAVVAHVHLQAYRDFVGLTADDVRRYD